MQIKNLKVQYQDKLIYKDFSLSIENDKTTCIMGPSGCGKTTLLNVLSNNVKYEGQVQDIKKTAYVFQSPRLIDALSVKKNLEFVLEKEDYNKIDTVLAMLKIDQLKDKYPHTLSGGEASRVSIARAILYNPKMLLLDEPFKDLDYALKHELLCQFKAIIKQNNLGCVYVTHDIDEALMMADRIIVLSKNEVQILEDVELDEKMTTLQKDEIRHKIYSALIK